MDSLDLSRRVVRFCRSTLAGVRRSMFPTSQELELDRYYREDDKGSLRFLYPLDQKSVVVDLGGFDGQWASDIFARYCCQVHVFEIVPEYAARINARFANNRMITAYDFGLGACDESVSVSLAGVSSSVHRQSSRNSVSGRIVRAADFLQQLGIDRVDLMKVNIEGGEYDLIRHLAESRWLGRIVDLQIQFHDFVDDADSRLSQMHAILSRTHRPTYQYRFVWENWRAINLAT